MSVCRACGSYAINHGHHGRDGSDGHLCDVCYWRARAEEAWTALRAIKHEAASLADAQVIALESLAATKARPATPDGLPTYDKEKALEWVAQLRDGNKEPKP